MNNDQGLLSGRILAGVQASWMGAGGACLARLHVMIGPDERYYLVQLNEIEEQSDFACRWCVADTLAALKARVKAVEEDQETLKQMVDEVFQLSEIADAYTEKPRNPSEGEDVR